MQFQSILFVAIQLLLLACEGLTFTPLLPTQTKSFVLNYRNDEASNAHGENLASKRIASKYRKKKPTIVKIQSLDELKYFLDDDDRPVAIKFYAPWCKTCQALGKHYDRLALELGDFVEAGQQVQGRIRFAQVEHSPRTKEFIMEQIKVLAIPTLQLYCGQNKLWEMAGKNSATKLREEWNKIEQKNLSSEELLKYAETLDDGILLEALEGNLYDYPSFLDEEW